MTPRKVQKSTTGRIMRNKGIPAAFMDNSSYRSPKFPKVIRAARRIANGRDNGISVSADRKKNWARTLISSPFPTSSSTYLHKNCIMKMKRQIKNVPEKSSRKLFKTNISSFLCVAFRFLYYQHAKVAQKTDSKVKFCIFYRFIPRKLFLEFQFASPRGCVCHLLHPVPQSL